MRTMILALGLLGLLLSTGCSDDPVGPTAGDLRVAVATTGGDLDLDGYGVSVDGVHRQGIGINETVTLTELPPGEHVVELTDVAANCSVTSGNPVSVIVVAGLTTQIAFTVACVATGIQVAAATAGVDLAPEGYGVALGGVPSGRVPSNGSMTLTRLSPGSYEVRLEDVAENCAVSDPNPVTVDVAFGEVVAVPFSASCVAMTGNALVLVTTTGWDPPAGYTVAAEDQQPQDIPRSGTRVLEGLAGGSHDIVLGDIPDNCVATEGSTRTVTVTTGGMTRDTVPAAFAVDCDPVWEVTFSRWDFTDDDYYTWGPWVTLARTDGSDPLLVTKGEAPAWSPDGQRIVFSATTCSYPWGCSSQGLWTMDTDGGAVESLTTNPSDTDPVWSPDGTRIAFSRAQAGGRPRLYTMNADGSMQAAVPLPSSLASAAHPSWSPDGSRLVFGCSAEPNKEDICVVNLDGTGFVRLTDDEFRDRRPAWSPDGSRIAFTSDRFAGVQELTLMDSDGEGVTRLAPGAPAVQPSWSPDGQRLAFVEFACDLYAGCRLIGLSTIDVDGSNHANLTGGDTDRYPRWRP